ncbi:DNA-3-methyladenine glycosylase I [Actinobacteria bacterium YIM 96077]|uniref:DNA-3-methyladenine glycosylase I n=1 Tax=Phytoactinopolyspora halophila TaxID=1981511 RepID=A0A329QR69_9ACTN|nr:DNA-3-methyladenine glycosylase I [Phytoactinopolyspora halophila]AYY14303.1 DNA-3-methyladenine glycosylase I [Actinobacteria bacterium YIM 96077]RAW14845.1 DNA-3-methyladenine glycosylase I [Phytoactinopolyspora halophila]
MAAEHTRADIERTSAPGSQPDGASSQPGDSGDGARPGPDGVPRCPWALGAPDYVAYHDEEWGKAVRGDAPLYERLILEGFQSGLSWLTILRKRDAFRRAFAGFDPAAVARFGEAEVERLMTDTSIVRNRKKIDATITNARALQRLREREGDDALDALIWSFVPDHTQRPAPHTMADLPATTPESAALARTLKNHGFVFVGPTTIYATMQAVGLVNDHLAGCAWRIG